MVPGAKQDFASRPPLTPRAQGAFAWLARRVADRHLVGAILNPRSIRIEMTIMKLGCRSLVLSAILVLCGALSVRAAEEMTFKLVIDGKWGPSVIEGKTTFEEDHFSINQWTFGQNIALTGQLRGDRMKVSGDWGGDYMSGEGGIVAGKFSVSMDATGNIWSAFISLSVPPSVQAKLGLPPQP